MIGCNEPKAKTRRRSIRPSANFLSDAMSFVFSEERFDYERVNLDIAESLDNWIDKLEEEADWELPKLITTLPKDIQNTGDVRSLGDNKFNPYDGYFLQGSAWAWSISDWTTKQENEKLYPYFIAAAKSKMDADQLEAYEDSPKKLTFALSILHPELKGEEESDERSGLEKLSSAVQLFDWTIRNIQLEKLSPEIPKSQIESAKLLNIKTTVPARAAIAGPGYQRSPFHALSFGRADWIERARTAILMMRQRDLDAFFLAVKNLDDENKLDPWAIGVLIDGKIFLFDAQLGLPIPSEDMQRIATLAEAKSSAKLLKSLDLKVSESLDDIDYPVKRFQLSSTVALLDASSETLSKRMKLVEDNLTGDQKMVLTVDVDSLAEKVKSIDGITDVRLATYPFRARQFRRACDEVFGIGGLNTFKLPQIRREKILDMKVVLPKGGFVSLSEARHHFLTGLFDEDITTQQKGAAFMYYQLKLTDEEIKKFDTDNEWRAVYGIFTDDGNSAQVIQDRITEIKGRMLSIRLDAGYFLALAHLENGNAATASRWVQQLAKERNAVEWSTGANYVTCRCLETLGEYETAISTLKRAKTNQHYGNILRSRLLKKWVTRSEEKTEKE